MQQRPPFSYHQKEGSMNFRVFSFAVCLVFSVVLYGCNNSDDNPSVSVPIAPANLVATPGDNQVTLSWHSSVVAPSYNIYRVESPNVIDFNHPFKTGVITTSYKDTTAVDGTTYNYAVTAVNSDGESTASNQISVEPASLLLSSSRGIGGHITLVNGTPYDWKNTESSSTDLNHWSFPDIPAFSSTTVYVEFEATFFADNYNSGNAHVTYILGDTGLDFKINASANSDNADLNVELTNISTDFREKGSVLDLGWQHNGYVEFILSGTAETRFTSIDLSTDWMHKNIDILGKRVLMNLSIPGSHDSGMSENTDRTAFAGTCNTQTQTHGILEQLNYGIRYFDIRPVKSGGTYYTGHYQELDVLGYEGANGQSIESIITDINQFTSTNQELIILNLSHGIDLNRGTAFDDVQWLLLLDVLSDKSNGLNHLYKKEPGVSNLAEKTLDSLISDSASVVIVLELDDEENPTMISNNLLDDAALTGVDLSVYFTDRNSYTRDFSVYNQYSNTNDINTMINNDNTQSGGPYYGQIPQMNFNDSTYFLLSWTLTQSAYDAANCSEDVSILSLANTANPALYYQILPNMTGTIYPNILYIDNVDTRNIAALAMAINNSLIHNPKMRDKIFDPRIPVCLEECF
jgi:hypothetical protein